MYSLTQKEEKECEQFYNLIVRRSNLRNHFPDLLQVLISYSDSHLEPAFKFG